MTDTSCFDSVYPEIEENGPPDLFVQTCAKVQAKLDIEATAIIGKFVIHFTGRLSG